MKIGKYELGPWKYDLIINKPYQNGYGWMRFAEIDSHHYEVCYSLYNWYSIWRSYVNPDQNLESHDSEIWEPDFYGRFRFIASIYKSAYGRIDEPMPLLKMTENCAKVVMDERMERIANLIAFA